MKGRVILCLDGTWNSTFKPLEREGKTSVLKPANPLKLARAILPVDPVDGTRQILYYDSGVGALGLYPGISNKLLNFADSKLGGAWGAGFEANIEQAVTFLAHNHAPEEKIFVFGFSRGAAQARGLTHFISWMGGLPEKTDAYYIPIFFRRYLDTGGSGAPSDVVSSRGDRPADRIRPVEVGFLGVWDTVMALGSRFQAKSGTSVSEKSFHVLPHPADCVRHARQALAIDEKRYDFRPEIWQTALEGQTLEQRWFAGVHGNVGGSYGNDGLANIALHWIVDEARAHGVAVDSKFLGKYRPFPQDSLDNSYGLGFKMIEAIRFKLGKGTRSLGDQPATSNLSIDPSVIKRLCSDPAKFKNMSEPYRSEEVVAVARLHKMDGEQFVRSYGLDPTKYSFPKDI
ncbi:phospholipase effector Tle1 domain-containing protein [Ruegeria hyattellae]|uniref:phospholipase effector Tle1 domain-containing protein n=1 Tax=Ruegeria hyattellae TaxID=3233337 RepID=UPI00355BBE02